MWRISNDFVNKLNSELIEAFQTELRPGGNPIHFITNNWPFILETFIKWEFLLSSF